jgi:DNA-binding NarL/FixJ family response regulator
MECREEDAMGKDKKRVVIVDDHPYVRNGIRKCLNGTSDFQVLAELDSSVGLEDALREHRPDLLLLDLSMEEGFEPVVTVQRLQEAFPDLKIVILSAHDEPRWVRMMHDIGVSGFVHKTEPPPNLLEALRSVMGGTRWFSRDLLQVMVDHYFHRAALDPTETYILQGVADGKTTIEIAGEMSVSDRTVREYLQHALEKLEVQSRAEAVAEAIRRGLIG